MPALIALLRKIFIFLLPHLLEWVKDKLVEYFKKARELKENIKKENEARKKYEAIVKDPASTKEEKDRAKAEFLNS